MGFQLGGTAEVRALLNSFPSSSGQALHPVTRPLNGPRFREVPMQRYQFPGLGLLLAVVGAAGWAAPVPTRDKRGKKGVTSNGILSRAEVMATGAVFTISALS